MTAHSAHVEFSAKEYTPTQDFEIVVELEGRQSEVVLIPHRRGDDGYFMVQLMPPGTVQGEGQLQRELLPNSEPLELVLLADTSASMDAPSRQRQAELIAALLAALTPKDKFNLGTCDVDCDWVFARPIAAEAKNIEMARQKLAARHSLGWTDLDKAMQAALRQCGPKTQVVYIGDGIVTTGDADPVAFTKRLRRLVEGKSGIFHAVAVSSSFEPGVMKAIAVVGGGSFRQVSGSHGPQAVAMELLGEITQPAIRDLKIEFSGLQTARVYPDRLPNLPLGTQQIILGRYQPQGNNQSGPEQTGEVIVTGTQGGKPVKFTARVSLPSASGRGDDGSFIPRLWARMHLDALLEQGASQAIKDEIIALSEEYHIITPYTSLLVLDNDADRERFGVKRRFQMRDGEKFFAQGRENANWVLIQQQMKQAGLWRLGLRQGVLRGLSSMGRELPVPVGYQPRYAVAVGGSSGMSGPFATGSLGIHGSMPGFRLSDSLDSFNSYSGGTVVNNGFLSLDEDASVDVAGNHAIWADDRDGQSAADDNKGMKIAELPAPSASPVAATTPAASEPWFDIDGRGQSKELGEIWFAERDFAKAELGKDKYDYSSFDREISAKSAWPAMAGEYGIMNAELAWRSDGRRMPMGGYPQVQPVDYSWLSNLFTPLPAPLAKPKEPKHPWPAEARKIVRSLLRGEQLTGVKDGLRIEIKTETFDPRWDALAGRSLLTGIVSPHGWLTVSESDGSQGQIAWADGRQRGAIARAMLLGRVRASKPDDLRQPPVDVGMGTTSPLDLSYQGYSVEKASAGENEVRLVLKHHGSPNNEIRILVDTARHVLVKIEHVNKGKVASSTVFGDFVEVAGTWYAGRIENTDADGRRTSLVTQKFSVLPAGEFDRHWKRQLAVRDQTQLLHDPLPRLIDAKKALASAEKGTVPISRNGPEGASQKWGLSPFPPATFEDRMVMLLHFQATQQWDRVLEHLAEAEKLSGKFGMKWVRMALLTIRARPRRPRSESLRSRRHLGPRPNFPKRSRNPTATNSSWPTFSSTLPAAFSKPTSSCSYWTSCGRSTSNNRPASWR